MSLAAAPAIGRTAPGRAPFLPMPDKWDEVQAMLCGHCARQPECRLPDAMLAFAWGRGPWPDDAWVTDPGAGCTCLSYAPQPIPEIPPAELALLGEVAEEALPHVCGGCAARKGSEASVALHTQRDYRAAVRDRSHFACHEDPTGKRLCGGWCRAVRRKEG